jgi:hypothetical protein
MIQIRTMVVLVAAIWASTAAAAEHSQAEVQHQIDRWSQAMRKRDLKVIGEIMHPDFRITSKANKESNRQQELEFLAKVFRFAKRISGSSQIISCEIKGNVAHLNCKDRLEADVAYKAGILARISSSMTCAEDWVWTTKGLRLKTVRVLTETVKTSPVPSAKPKQGGGKSTRHVQPTSRIRKQW